MRKILKRLSGAAFAAALLFSWQAASITARGEETPRRDDFVGHFLARYVTTFLNMGNNRFPSDESNAVLQTGDGYMWFGGYNGLYRYDGAKYTVWDAVSPGGFGSQNIRALYEAEDGTLWIGTNDKGLVAYRNGAFEIYDRTAGIPSNTIRDIAEDADGGIYCGTPEGIFYVGRDGSVNLVPLDTDIRQAVVSLCFDGGGNLYAVLNGGELFVLTGDGATVRRPHSSPVHSVGCVSDGRVIAGTRDGEALILRFGGGGFTLSEEKTTPLANISSVYEDSNGYIWLTSETGVGFLDNSGSYRHVGNPGGAGFFSDICEDYQNGYWITATRGGITKLTVGAFSDFNALLYTETGSANAVFMDNDDVYIGTNDGLFAVDKSGRPIHTELTGMIDGRVRGISGDTRGNVWICVYSELGVIRYDPKTKSVKSWTDADGMTSERTRVAHELANGVMAVGTAEGISFIKGDEVISANEAFETNAFIELPEIMVLSLVSSTDGTLYIGTDGDGVYAINKEGTVRYREEDGLTGGVVLRMLSNPNDNGVWVAASPGLCYIDGDGKTARVINKVPPYTFLDALRYKDDIVLLTSGMIIRTDAEKLLVPEFPFAHTSVGQASGLTVQISANARNMIADNGDLYFCTDAGVSIYSFESVKEHFVPYAGIAAIEIDGREYSDFRGVVKIPRDANRITFEMSLLSFGLTDDTVLVYMLSGQS
ncbi:MAG: hypothetical protein LBI36_04220, partial [Oscillospiraceae bacterium]|nr:hypothetical protein [Oscillospiraceae bacterium]